MNFNADLLGNARKEGYSDDEIWDFVASQDERFKGAKQEGYSLDEVADYFSKQAPVGTSIEQEVSQLGAALKSGIAQPLQAMGVTAETLGMPEAGAALKGAIEQPEGYVPAAQRFMEPQAGEAQLGGFAFQYLPRAIVEQVGQLGGSIVSRAAGGIIGGAAGSVIPGAGTAVGAGIGMFTGPALFEAAQIVGPVAQERAKNNGREIPNSEDLAYAWTTAGTSGALNAIGAKYLPGGEKAVGALTKRIAASFLGESATEGAQALTQQTGETILTEKGLEIQPKAALGEALIGGVSAGGATILMSPLQKEQVDIDKEADLESRDLSVPVDDPEIRANLDKVAILEQENKDSFAIINKFGVESEEGKVAQKTIVDNANEITNLKKILPTSVSLTITEAEQGQIDKAAQMMSVSTQIDNLKEEIDNDEMSLQAFETGTPERQQAEMALNAKKANLTQLEGQFAKLSAAPAPAKEAAPTEAAPETKEQILTRIGELNKEFDALAEEDTAGQERVNKAIFAEQNKLAEMTAIEQGVEPQAVTPTRAVQPPPSGRQYPYGTFYPERPVLQAFLKAADKAVKGIRVAGKRAQKLKNAIRTNITRNAGFLAGINAEVISSEEYGKLTGGKQVAADTGTYRAAYFNGKKYLVLPDVNQLTATTIKGEQRAASRDAALDQESRAADKKLEEEMIHLSMYQALQDEYAGLKKPKQTEQKYIVNRISQIAKEVKRTNPNAVPGVSEVYLGPEMGTLDDVGFSMEFMRMVIQRVRTGQITEDLNAIRTAEREAFSDADKGAIASLKNSILNALKFVRNSLARYLGKGTSTREVKRMEDSINAILDEYGIVKGEANYEFKDYSAAQPKGEVSLTITPTEEAAPAEPTAPAEGEIVAMAGKSRKVLPTPPERRVDFKDIVDEIIDMFGNDYNGKNLRVIDNVRKKSKASYQTDGIIFLNQAYIDKDDSIRDLLAHELGHFVAGDPETRPIFKEFLDSIPENERAKLERFVDKVYKKDTEEIRLEEKEVRAFIMRLNAGDNRNIFQRFLDKIKEYINKKYGKNFKLTDRGATLLLAGAIERFKSGEFIERKDDGSRMVAAVSEMDADYLDAVERGDMETAQRMVNEASGFSKINPPKKVNFYRNYLEIASRQGYYTQEEVERYSNQFADPATEGVTASDRERDFIKYWVAEKILENGIEQNWRQSLNLSEAIIPNDSTPKQARASVANWVNTILPPVTYDDAGNVIPLSQRFDVTTPLIARAAPTPRVVSEQRRITDKMLGDLSSMIETLQPKRSRAGKEYVSRTTQKGKTYPASLVSPYSRAANLYTSNTYEEATKALNKLFTKNPDADFFSVVTDVANQSDRYGLSESEKGSIVPLLYRLLPAYREEIMESRAAIKDRESIALKSLDLEANLAKIIVDQQQASARTLNSAKAVRQIGSAGTAVAAYKSKIIDGLADLYTIIRGDFTQVAEAVRGDRRKAVDNVFTLKEVLSRISQLKAKAEKNPQAAVNAIRKAVAGKKTRKAREIVLEFCASMFDTKGDKYANMVVDETAKAIMSIGADRKDFSPDNVYKYIYQAFGAVAKQTAKEAAAKEAEPKAKEVKKREGKYLAQVKSVIGNDKAYKQFIAELKTKIGSLYQDNAEFQDKYKELFSMLEDRQWSEAMRNQAIKDSADFLDYKFNDLISYIGENRYAAQSAVKTHIKAELAQVGATDEQIDKFIEDTQNYLDEETAKRVKKSLGFEISKETGRIIGGKIEKEAMKKVATAEERFQLAKTLKGLTKLAATDQRAFLDKLNELIITELGFDEATSKELSKYIEEQMAKAIQAQKSENLQQAIKKAQETLAKNNIKSKANQRTVLQRLIEMANMGQLDDMGVYEAFRQTHDFGKGYLEWNPNLAQELREWGDRISALPEGVARSIEEQKMGRFMLENQVFSGRDYFSSYWYFSLLSQLGTQAVNFLGSTFNLLGNITVWSIYTKGKSTGPMLRALYDSTIRKEAPARNAFAYAMQTGLNPSGIQDERMMKYPRVNLLEGANPKNTPKWVYNLATLGDGQIEALPKWLNETLKTISPRGMMRVMRATDAFMREAAYEVRAASFGAARFQQDAYKQAKEQAIRELASSKTKGKQKEREIIIRANEIYSQQRLEEESRIKAEQDALETIYSQTPVGVVGSIAGLANKMLQVSPVTQLFIPFSNVVANVLNENLNYLPVVGASRLAAHVKLVPLLKGKIELKPSAAKSEFIMGREEKAADIAIKSAIGFAAMAVPVIIAALTGGDDEDQKERPKVQFYATGPADPEQNKIWKENGGTPYSMRVGDKYISYLYTPLVIPLATGSMLAEFYDRFEKKKEKSPIDAVEAVVTVAVAPFAIGFVAALDQSFLTGVADLIELKEARDIPAGAKNIATNIISRLAVPGVMRDMQKMLTDEKLEGDIYVTNLFREFPGSSAFLDKKLGYFGEPARYNSIMEENGPGRRALSLVARIASSETPDQAFQIMYRNGLNPPKWQGSLQWSNEVRMTKAEQREFVGIAGPLMKEWIIDNEETLDELPTEEAQEFLSNNIGSIRRSVKADLEFEKGIEVDLE